LTGAVHRCKFGAKIMFGVGLFDHSSLTFQVDLDVIEHAGDTRVGDCFGPRRVIHNPDVSRPAGLDSGFQSVCGGIKVTVQTEVLRTRVVKRPNVNISLNDKFVEVFIESIQKHIRFIVSSNLLIGIGECVRKLQPLIRSHIVDDG